MDALDCRSLSRHPCERGMHEGMGNARVQAQNAQAALTCQAHLQALDHGGCVVQRGGDVAAVLVNGHDRVHHLAQAQNSAGMVQDSLTVVRPPLAWPRLLTCCIVTLDLRSTAKRLKADLAFFLPSGVSGKNCFTSWYVMNGLGSLPGYCALAHLCRYTAKGGEVGRREEGRWRRREG